MISILLAGTLIADPQSRTASGGKPYATAKVRAPVEDGDAVIASVIAFDAGVVAALLALSKGDACSIAGRGKLSTWEKDGETRTGLSIVADRVLSAYQAGRMRKAARDSEPADA